MRPLSLFRGVSATLILGFATFMAALSLDNGERAMVFTTAASLRPDGDAWSLPLRGMVYEPEDRSPERRLALAVLRKAIGLEEGSEEAGLFRRRAAAFLVDRESRGRYGFRFPAADPYLPLFPHLATGREGRFSFDPPLPVEAFESFLLLRDRGPTKGWVEVAITTVDGRMTLGRGWIQCVPPEGVTVVSDIDDTVKDTRVLDRKEMLANTFLRPFRAVPGMAAAYDRWAREGAVFEYLSAGPVPLQGFLQEFLDGAGFPPGPLTMREFRWNRKEIDDLLGGDPAAFKGERLDDLAERFPRRRFVLVGDSGERDPEAYGAFARRRPNAVSHIFIRDVVPGGSPPERWTAAFEGLDPRTWTVFTDPAALGALPR